MKKEQRCVYLIWSCFLSVYMSVHAIDLYSFKAVATCIFIKVTAAVP